MQPEDYIQSEAGKRMYRAVTPFYEDEYQLSIFNANGAIMQEVLSAADKMTFEVLINNATWALPYWEQLFRVKSADNETIEQRRRAVILKMNEYFPVSRKRMESISGAFAEGGEVSIDDTRGDYIFEVIFKNPGSIDFDGLIEALEDTKPSHFDYTFRIDQDRIWYVGGALVGAENTILYPYVEPVKDIEADWKGTGAMYETEKVELEGDFT